MTRVIGAGIRQKLVLARKVYKGKGKPGLSLKTYNAVIKGLQTKGLHGGASGASWFTPWKWDAEDWKAVGTGLAYGVDAVVIGSLKSKTIKQLIKTAISTGSSAQLATMGIIIPPTVIAVGTDAAIDAFIAGIIMAHDYIVGDNEYQETVDELFKEVDKYAPQIIKGAEIAVSAIGTAGVGLLENTITMRGLGFTKHAKDALEYRIKKAVENTHLAVGSSKNIVMIPMPEFKAEHTHLLDILKNPTKEKLDAEYAKQSAEMKKEVSGKGIDEQLDFLGMSEADYLKKAKAKAKKEGYDPKKLYLCTDEVHKLDYDGIKFGRVGYGDHILYKYLESVGEVPKGTASKKRRVFRASHGAMKDKGKMSANQLSINILW